MSEPKFIDPIKVREERQRQEVHLRLMQAGTSAADALLWFHEYAQSREIQDILTVRAEPIAGSTPNASAAAAYIAQAASRFARQVLDSAIAAAQRDLDSAEAARKPRPQR